MHTDAIQHFHIYLFYYLVNEKKVYKNGRNILNKFATINNHQEVFYFENAIHSLHKTIPNAIKHECLFQLTQAIFH